MCLRSQVKEKCFKLSLVLLEYIDRTSHQKKTDLPFI